MPVSDQLVPDPVNVSEPDWPVLVPIAVLANATSAPPDTETAAPAATPIVAAPAADKEPPAIRSALC